jgi:hypothetical protein
MLGFDIKTTSAKDALEVYDNVPEEAGPTAKMSAKSVPSASVTTATADAPTPASVDTPRVTADSVLGIGTRVRAKLPSWESMYPGVITAVQANNKYAVRFDDGDEQSIKGYLIEPEVAAAATAVAAAPGAMVAQSPSGALELPDRNSFETERAYLKHIYKMGWFEFKDRSNEKVTRLPGQLHQQMFELQRLTNCEIELLDDMNQVTGDYLDSCTGFIGPSSESVFLRDCKDCILTIACKQLRLRDCHNCIFFLYSHTDPALEGSTNCQFAPFNGAYAGLRDLFAKAHLDPEDNHWREIFDFHKDMTVTKEGKAIPEPHWFNLPEEDFYENRLELDGLSGAIENPVPLDAASKHLGEEDEGGMLGFDIKTTSAKDALEVYDNVPEEAGPTAKMSANAHVSECRPPLGLSSTSPIGNAVSTARKFDLPNWTDSETNRIAKIMRGVDGCSDTSSLRYSTDSWTSVDSVDEEE